MQASHFPRDIRRSIDRLSFLTLVFSALVGCDRAGQESSSYRRPVVQASLAFALSDTPVLVIGGVDEREDYAIGRTIGALRLTDGRVVVADGMTRQLRYYDGHGQHLRTVGGDGDGPGEFRRLHSIVRMQNDSILAWDTFQRRVSVFAPDATFSYSVTNPAWSGMLVELQKQYPRSILDFGKVHFAYDDRFVVELAAGPYVRAITGKQLIQDTLPLLAISRTEEDWTVLGSFAGREHFVQEGVGGAFALGPNLRVAAAEEVVYAGSTRDTAIRALSPVTGEIVRSIALPWRRRATSPEDVEIVSRRFLDRVQPNLASRAAEFVASIPWPDSLPTFSHMLVGADERVWVQMFRAPADVLQEWILFEPSGEIVASFAMDTSLQLLDVGDDYALVQAADGNGVETITMHRLVPTDIED